jgi:hypothetical protein
LKEGTSDGLWEVFVFLLLFIFIFFNRKIKYERIGDENDYEGFIFLIILLIIILSIFFFWFFFLVLEFGVILSSRINNSQKDWICYSGGLSEYFSIRIF